MTKFLFTTLPTNDLGLLTRSLPIARELTKRGHRISFCSPAKAPSRLIADAGFENDVPRHPIYDLMEADQKLKALAQLIRALPIKFAPNTPDVWNFDHTGAIMGMLNEGFLHANCEALKNTIADSAADVVVDFLNQFAVIAARALQKPFVTVIQGNFHPASGGFIWWKSPPSTLPTPAPTVSKVLAHYGLPLQAFATMPEKLVRNFARMEAHRRQQTSLNNSPKRVMYDKYLSVF